MKISITAEELIDKMLWEEVCEMKGINVWAVNEGLMATDEIIELTEEQAKKLGLIKEE
jgi:hypothetical protein